MTTNHSHALALFGTTGDLAYKKVFPALQAMVKRGHLNVRVIASPMPIGISAASAAGAG